MNKGSISELVLKRSVLKHVRRDKDVVINGAAIGNDASLIKIDDNEILTASGYADSFEIGSGATDKTEISVMDMAFIRACNNIYASGGSSVTAEITVTLGASKREGCIRKMMNDIAVYAAEKGISIIGGDTKISGVLKDDAVTVSVRVIGKKVYETDKIKAGDRLIICRNAGSYGASNLVTEHRDRLSGKLPESYLDEAIIKDKEYFDISSLSAAAYGSGAKYVHDISFGGIYTAIYQSTDRASLGVKVIHENIPVDQKTIEISEALGINPYLLCGTGGLIAVCSPEHEEEVLKKLSATLYQKEGINPGDDISGICHPEVKSAGEYTKEKLRYITSEVYKINRVIDLPDGDSIFI